MLHGEQYIRVDSLLYQTELLEEIRPWMTLDSDPADHQRLNDQLEAWSLFPAGDYLFVVRLSSSGVYDRRAAYFAHGRAWRRDALRPGFDPGLHLARSEAFDAPWRDERLAAPVPDMNPSVVRVEQIRAETQTATRLLAHLLQAMAEQYPLVIAAPVADFASGSALHALVAVSRAGLPSAVQRGCRVRVYSRFPELFLRHLAVSLLVVPEEAASAALTARPAATLVDRQGRKIAGKEAGERALAYATSVIERVVAIPDGLPFFTARIRESSIADPRAVQITYNLAFAFAGDSERRAEVLRRYLPRTADKLGPSVPWGELIRESEWGELPREALLDELLTDTSTLSPGRREFLRAAEDGAARRGLRVDERLAAWWDASHPGKLARLVELLAHEPPLVSSRAAASRTAAIPLSQLASTASLAIVLQAEAQSGQLAQRAHESAELARAATDEAVFTILTRAVADGALTPDWARAYVQRAAPEELVQAATRWLDDVGFLQTAWGDVPVLLLDRLRTMERLPASLAPVVTSTGRALNVAANFEIYVRLADLLTRIEEAEGRQTESTLVAGLWSALPRLGETGLERLEQIAFDPAWRCVQLPRLDVATLLELASGFRNEESVDAICGELDSRMRTDANTTTEALVRGGWWYFWRRRSRLQRANASDAYALRKSALAWLGSPFWSETGAEATLEAWDAVFADLPRTLESCDFAALRGSDGSRRWPWIRPFEEEQLEELIDRVADLGALAELTEAVLADRAERGSCSLHGILSRSRFKGDMRADALAWLIGDSYPSARPTLTLAEAAYLLTHAGHRKEQALAARIDAVATALHHDRNAALRAAGDPTLWSDGRFLTRVAAWMNDLGSLAAIGAEAAKWIDEAVEGEPESTLQKPSASLVRELSRAGLHRAARLLHPQLSNDLQNETLADRVIDALLAARPKDRCWSQLAEQFDCTSEGKHPLETIVNRILNRELSPHDRKRLAAGGWRTYEAAAREHPALLSRLSDEVRVARLLSFAAAMLPPGGLGSAALQLTYAVTGDWRNDWRWWQRVINAMRSWKRHTAVASADDREDAACAVIYAHVDEPGQRALSHALGRETGWAIPAELGEGTL